MTKYKLVPVEPTPEMLKAADVESGSRGLLSIALITWQAMLAAAPEVQAKPVAYMHCPSVAMDAKVRPVLSFEKYEGDYASGIYAERIPLYTRPQPAKQPLTDEELRQCAEAMDAEPLAEGWRELLKFARAIEAAHGIAKVEGEQ